MKLRLLQGMEAKAKRGELIRVLAPGYVCDLAGQIVKDPNGTGHSALHIMPTAWPREGWVVAKRGQAGRREVSDMR